MIQKDVTVTVRIFQRIRVLDTIPALHSMTLTNRLFFDVYFQQQKVSIGPPCQPK